jgi:hypothetical protein
MGNGYYSLSGLLDYGELSYDRMLAFTRLILIRPANANAYKV